MFDFDFYQASLFEHKIIKPNYTKEGANGVALWYELDFGTHKFSTLTQKKDKFKQLVWSINLKKEINLETVFNKNHIFIGSYKFKEDKK